MSMQEIHGLLKQVKDPEIPTVSIVDLGMINEIRESANGYVEVDIIPTFIGCPALTMIKRDIVTQLMLASSINDVQVNVVLDPPWSSDRISEEGRNNLKQMGIAPPPLQYHPGDPWVVNCPFCESTKTIVDNLFGPTACRSILYCSQCKNPFEAIKPI
jgi:ring-1,2-phenylacetyl-CoA epoxidase subunit PaaD